MHRNRPPIASGRNSPFFAPSTPKPQVLVTPNGSRREQHVDTEKKSTVSGAAFNLINAVIGAGIVGIPFALRECGLVYGVVMVIICALICVKSLRLLVDTAKHVDVPTYETLMEATFGKPGFIFISINMFIMSYGAMVGYLIVIKSTLPALMGVALDDYQLKRAILTVASLSLILPISLQRDIGSLAKTSLLSVIFDIIIVLIIVTYSPIATSVEKAGGITEILSQATFQPKTFFLGLGVLSFAFVCQHSAFIIAGSLERPTRARWNKVTGNALLTCVILALVMGISGFLGFMDSTTGNILKNLNAYALRDESVALVANIASGLLCTTMCFVYPVESFVARHVCVVLFFKGRRAHDGDDHSVLSRTDRRVAITVALYLMALIPALLFDDLGSVFAATGALGGSSLSYIGPGLAYLAVHGSEFLDMASSRWGFVSDVYQEIDPNDVSTVKKGCIAHCFDTILWYICLMPVWCAIAQHGQYRLRKHEETEALKSPHPYRLGKVTHRKRRVRNNVRSNLVQQTDEEQDASAFKSVIRNDSLPRRSMLPLPNASPNMNVLMPGGGGGVGLNNPNAMPRTDSEPMMYIMPSQDGFKPIMSAIKQAPEENQNEGHASYGTSNNAVDPREKRFKSNIADDEQKPLLQNPLQQSKKSSFAPIKTFGSAGNLAEIAQNNKKIQKNAEEIAQNNKKIQKNAEDDPQDDTPRIIDFLIAISLVVFGIIAACAGLFSVFAA